MKIFFSIDNNMIVYITNGSLIWDYTHESILFLCFSFFPIDETPKEPKLSDWLWEIKERRRQKDRSLNYRALLRLTTEKNNMGPNEPDPSLNGTDHAAVRPVVNVTVEQFLAYGHYLTEERMAAQRAKQDREEAAANQQNNNNNNNQAGGQNNRLSVSWSNTII